MSFQIQWHQFPQNSPIAIKTLGLTHRENSLYGPSNQER